VGSYVFCANYLISFAKYFPSDHEIKGGELRGLYCAEEKRKADMFVWGRLTEGDHLKNLGVGGNDNIEIDIKYIEEENMDCFHLDRSKDQLRFLVTTLMTFQVP
jgi:hypothetical protein